MYLGCSSNFTVIATGQTTLRQEIFAVSRLRSEIGEIKMPQKILFFYLNSEIEMSENKVPRLKREIKMPQKNFKDSA